MKHLVLNDTTLVNGGYIETEPFGMGCKIFIKCELDRYNMLCVSGLFYTLLSNHLNDFNFISTLGTGTFGRVRLVKHRDDPAEANPLALKCLKKSYISAPKLTKQRKQLDVFDS